ncbi:MAG TPA: DNA repair protein RecO [Methylomirabilota bacterium]|nr:DNA repair protein RecO [Methylomirabilota bacterium]
MGLEKTRAVAGGSRPLGEADKLLTFYTREFGKLRGVAKGARRVRSKFGSALELFTYGQLVFFERPRSELIAVDHFDIIHPFQIVREDLERLGRGAWIVECVTHLTADRDPQPALFGLLLRALRALEGRTRPEWVTLCFALRAADLTGHRPRLDRCHRCGKIPGRRVRFDPGGGGLLCPDCPAAGVGTLLLSSQALSALRRLHTLRWDERLRVQFPRALELEMLTVVEGYIHALIGYAPRVDRFLEQTQLKEGVTRASPAH